MVRKFCLVAIALVGIAAWGGCRSPYGGRRTLSGSACGCEGGCNGSSCPVGGSTYAPATSGGTVLSAPVQGSYGGGGSGMRGGGGGSGTR